METNLIEKLKSIAKNISEIEVHFGKQAPADNPEIKLEFADKLTDETPVIFSPDLSEGATVMLTTTEGTQPAADGEYILAESKKTVTVYAGKVSKIEDTKDTPALEELTRVMTEKLSAQFAAVAKITELETKLSKQEEHNQKLIGIMSQFNEALVELSAAKPTQEPVTPTKNGFNPQAFADALEEIKNLKSKN